MATVPLRQVPHRRRRGRVLAVVALVVAGVVVLVVGLVGGFAVWAYASADQSNVGELGFDNELAVPPLAEPTVDADGRKVFDLRFTAGRTQLVDEGTNGTYDPYVEATTELVRFRVLNASNARIYNLGFTDDRRFWQVATDSGLLERPVETRRLQVSPGERVEIVVAVEPGDETVLRSFAPDLGFPLERFSGGDDTFDIVQLRGAARLDRSPALPDQLATIDRPDPDDAATTRSFRLGGTQINSRNMDMDRIDATVTDGTTEIWELSNDDGQPHSFHPHLVHFAVLDVDGDEPPPELSGWKDTIYVPPSTTIRIVARFEGYPGPHAEHNPYMFHCHVLRHEDNGMMGQFLVTDG